MSHGEYFGELALIRNDNRDATVTSFNQVKCLAVGKQDLLTIFGDDWISFMYNNIIILALEKDELLSKLNSS